jgi:hypothetical protein
MVARRLVSSFTAVAVLFAAAWCACAQGRPLPSPSAPVAAGAHHCCDKAEDHTSVPDVPQGSGEHHCHHCRTGGSLDVPRGGPAAPGPFDVVLTLQTPQAAVPSAAGVAVPSAPSPAERDLPPPTLLNLRCALLR